MQGTINVNLNSLLSGPVAILLLIVCAAFVAARRAGIRSGSDLRRFLTAPAKETVSINEEAREQLQLLPSNNSADHAQLLANLLDNDTPVRSVSLYRRAPIDRRDVADLDPSPSREGDYATIQGAAFAMKNPPNDVRAAITYMKSAHRAQYGTEGHYLVPLVWHMQNGSPSLEWVSLVGENNVNHMLVTGLNDRGKDNLLIGAVIALTLQHTPEELELWIIDPKGLDWGFWEMKAHTKMLHLGPDNVEAAMEAITRERRRRRKIIREAQKAGAAVRKWDHLERKPPLMLIVITELTNLAIAAGSSKNFDSWMSGELTELRAFGGRCLIGTQLVNNMGTNWRGQISLFAGGQQSRSLYDEPNVTLSASEITAVSQGRAVAPSQLPSEKGLITLVRPPHYAVTGRSMHVSDELLMAYLKELPNRFSASGKSMTVDTSDEALPTSRPLDIVVDLEEATDTPKTPPSLMGPLMTQEELRSYVRQKREEEPAVTKSSIAYALYGRASGDAWYAVTRAWETLAAETEDSSSSSSSSESKPEEPEELESSVIDTEKVP